MDKGTEGVAAALRLLERNPDPAYIEEWTDILSQPKEFEPEKGITAIIFRLGKEWLAIASKVFNEVIADRSVHRIPHRTNDVLKGLVNYQGILTLCVNMHRFLDIEPVPVSHEKNPSRPKFSRMVAISKDHELWIFPVDEVHGVITFYPSSIGNTPVTLSKSTSNYLHGVITWNDMDVGYLDDELLFFGLKRKLL